MNLASINQWLSALALLIGIINALWIWLSRPAKDTNARIDLLDNEMHDRADRHREELKLHDRRIQRVEDNLPHLPTREDIGRLSNAMTAMKTELDMVARTTNRIDEHLRSRP